MWSSMAAAYGRGGWRRRFRYQAGGFRSPQGAIGEIAQRSRITQLPGRGEITVKQKVAADVIATTKTTASCPYPLVGLSGLLVQHFHRVLQTAAHSVERGRERSDFVVTAMHVFRRVELPHADLGCHVRNADNRLYDENAQQHVDDHQHQEEYANQPRHQEQQAVIGALQRHGERDRNYLRRDDLVQLPAKAISRAIQRDHCRRRRFWGAVASQAALRAHLQWAR